MSRPRCFRSALLLLTTILGLATCARPVPTERIRLLAPTGGDVADRCTVDGDSREARRLEADEAFRVRIIVPANAVLRYATATPTGAPATLSVTVTEPGSDHAVTDEATVSAHWDERDLDLAPVAGREVEIEARATNGPVCWGAPAVFPVKTGPSLVIVVLLDTVRADHVSLLGYARPTTPVLQQLAREAVTFTDAASDVSWTRGSVATLMTGQPSMVHGVLNRDAVLGTAHATMAELLRAHGFRTVALSTNPNVLPVWGFGRGFDQFVDVDAEHWSANTNAARVLEHARTAVGAAGREPLFLYVHLNDAHAPYDPPADVARRLLGTYDESLPGKNPTANADARTIAGAVDRYDAEIANMDAQLGEFFAFLAAQGRWRDSLLVIVGDHGEEFRDHGGIYHGHTLFREQLHVPLLMKLPALAGGGTRITDAVSVVDVLPTMLGVLNTADPALPGRVLLDARGQSIPGASLPRFANTDMDGTTVYAVEDASATFIVQTHPAQRRWLFDRVKDPLQWRNLGNERPDDLERLQRLLDERLAAYRHGWHVRVCGGAASRTIALRIGGAGAASFARVELEAEDEVKVAPDGVITLTSDLRPQQRQEESFGKLVPRIRPDADELVIPAADELQLEFEDAPLPVRKGLAREPVTMSVVTVTATEATIPAVYVPTCPGDPTVLVWQTGVATTAEHVNPEILERLKALGYAH